MRQSRFFDSFIIEENGVDEHRKVIHLHNYYQFIFIRAGSGKHYLNGEVTDFQKGNLFFTSPKDEHSFEISNPARICSVKFNELSKGKLKSLQKALKGEFAGLKKGRSLLNIKVVFSARDEQIAAGIFDLLNLLKEEIIQNESLIHLQLIMLVSLIERNLSYGIRTVKDLTGVPEHNKSLERLLAYIHRHISSTEMLTAVKIAEHHGISAHYIGVYFKKLAGMTLQNYINECRQNIIERKLLTTELSVTQLAADFNFTDESHFNKSFKKYWGVSPLKYRMQQKNKE